MGSKVSLRTKRLGPPEGSDTMRTEESQSNSTARSQSTADSYRMRWDEKYAS